MIPCATGMEEMALIKGLSGAMLSVLFGIFFNDVREVWPEIWSITSVRGLNNVPGREMSLPVSLPIHPPDT